MESPADPKQPNPSLCRDPLAQKARDTCEGQSCALAQAALPVQGHIQSIPSLLPLPIATEGRDNPSSREWFTYSFLLLGINLGSLCIHWLRNL